MLVPRPGTDVSFVTSFTDSNDTHCFWTPSSYANLAPGTGSLLFPLSRSTTGVYLSHFFFLLFDVPRSHTSLALARRSSSVILTLQSDRLVFFVSPSVTLPCCRSIPLFLLLLVFRMLWTRWACVTVEFDLLGLRKEEDFFFHRVALDCVQDDERMTGLTVRTGSENHFTFPSVTFFFDSSHLDLGLCNSSILLIWN